MAKTSTKTTRFDFPPEKVLEAQIQPDFQVAQRKLDEAVVDAEYHELSRSDARLVFEVRATEYDRGLTGINRSKTLQTTTRVEWDLKNLKATWRYSTPVSERFDLTGTHQIQAVGDGCKLVSENRCSVKMPLVGGRIEKAVIQGMDKGRDAYCKLIRDYCRKLTS